MPYSALALGLASPRLRSRRRRSDSSHRLSIWLAVATFTAAGLVGFVGVGENLQVRSSPLGSTRLDQQRYLQAVWPIYLDLEVNANRMGLAAALYADENIDRLELANRIDTALASYLHADYQLGPLQPPEELEAVHQGYLEVVSLLERAAIEMRKAGEDGDESHLSAAVPLMLEGTARMHALASRFWPARVG